MLKLQLHIVKLQNLIFKMWSVRRTNKTETKPYQTDEVELAEIKEWIW